MAAVLTFVFPLVVAACGDDENVPTADVTSSSSSSSSSTSAVAADPLDLGAGFTLVGHPDWTVEQRFELPDEPSTECGSLPASIDTGSGWVAIRLPAAVCAGAVQEELLNDQHGEYVSIDDVAEPRAVVTSETMIGPATTFEQTYTECTNECVDYVDRVALIPLDPPVEPDRPTLMVRANGASVDEDEFAEVLASLRRP